MLAWVFMKSDKNSVIYKITNKINNKFYIGSAVQFNLRKNAHLSYLKKEKHPNKHLQNSFNKYGIENFEFTIIEYVENKYNLIEKEQYYIDILKPDYNICKIAGSCLGIKRRQETKDKISNSNKGRIISIETREKIRNTLKGRKNKPHTKESKLKMSLAQKGKNKTNKDFLKYMTALSLNKTQKKIEEIDINGNILNTFISVAEAGRICNLKYRSISNVLTGFRKTINGRIFRYSIN